MFNIHQTSKFEKDIKNLVKQHYHLTKLQELIDLLAVQGANLPGKYRNHYLKGNWQGHLECHLDETLIVIYIIQDTEITLVRLGTHSELLHK